MLMLAFMAGCKAAPTGSNNDNESDAPLQTDESINENSEHDADNEHNEESDHEHASERIANDGAAVQITAPADGAIFKTSDEIIVQIAVDNFKLGENGNHWHVYVDDSEYGMITGENNDEVLRSLEPGEHEIAVYLANGDHQELEDGDTITIQVDQ